MDLIQACVYCGVDRYEAISNWCYTDLMAEHLVTPQSPSDVVRKHYWIEAKVVKDWYGKGAF